MNNTLSQSSRIRRPGGRLPWYLGAMLLCLVVFPGAKLLSTSGQAQVDSAKKSSPRVGPNAGTRGRPRLREGMRLVDQIGYFRGTGDRVAFFTNNGKTRLIGLENLNLQRVATAIGEQPTRRVWKVTGTVTEYRGENYLLLDRAILESWEKSQIDTP